MATTEIHFADDAYAIATHGDVFINVQLRPVTPALMRETRRVLKVHSAACAGPSRSISVLTAATTQGITDEVREEAAAMMRETRSLGAVIVIEGEGFGAAMLRTMIAGIYMVQRHPYPHHIAATVPAGVRWIVEKTAAQVRRPISEAELVDAVEAARRAIGRRPATVRP